MDSWHFQTSEVIFLLHSAASSRRAFTFWPPQSAVTWFKLPAGTTENHSAPTTLTLWHTQPYTDTFRCHNAQNSIPFLLSHQSFFFFCALFTSAAFWFVWMCLNQLKFNCSTSKSVSVSSIQHRSTTWHLRRVPFSFQSFGFPWRSRDRTWFPRSHWGSACVAEML